MFNASLLFNMAISILKSREAFSSQIILVLGYFSKITKFFLNTEPKQTKIKVVTKKFS